MIISHSHLWCLVPRRVDACILVLNKVYYMRSTAARATSETELGLSCLENITGQICRWLFAGLWKRVFGKMSVPVLQGCTDDGWRQSFLNSSYPQDPSSSFKKECTSVPCQFASLHPTCTLQKAMLPQSTFWKKCANTSWIGPKQSPLVG